MLPDSKAVVDSNSSCLTSILYILGNNGSAFIEVLVGRSTGEEYEVLLVASSFMSPSESKSWTNTNRVRFFGKRDKHFSYFV